MIDKNKDFSTFGEAPLNELEATEYAEIINKYPITHEDCMNVLKVVAEIGLRTRYSGEKIAEELRKIYSKFLEL